MSAQQFKIETAGVFVNLSTLSGLSSSLVVTNNSSSVAYAVVSATQPSASALGILCQVGEEVFIQRETGKSIWIKLDYTGHVIVQPALSASAQYVVATLPPALLTSGPEGYQRLRVDNSETSFFLGESFRTFYDYSLGASSSITIRFTRATDVILQGVNMTCDKGTVRLEVYRGSTPAGTWSTTLPIIAKNEMTTRPAPVYVTQSTLTAGGTISGGTLRDIVRIVSPTATAQQQTAGLTTESKRGVAAGTTGYYRITNFGTGTATGVFRIEWEERP